MPSISFNQQWSQTPSYLLSQLFVAHLGVALLLSILPFQAALVHTVETTRIRFFMDLLIQKGIPVMLVGLAGTGKTVLMNDKLTSLNPDLWAVTNAPFNFYTTSGKVHCIH